jgi:hypothetical protein
MPGCYDNHLSIQLICACATNPVVLTASHEATLENYTGQNLYDVTFLAATLVLSMPSRLAIAAPGASPAPIAAYSHGQLSPGTSAKVTFALSSVGSGPRTETIETVADWALSLNTPLTGTPPQRFDRTCQYNISVQ